MSPRSPRLRRLLVWGLVLGMVVLVTGAVGYHERRTRLRGTIFAVAWQLAKSRLRDSAHQSAACASHPVTVAHPTNVVLIAVDTLRATRMGFLGYERRLSPNLDALAGDSIVFRNARSAAPWTLPSFASVFTGLHPGALGITSRWVPMPQSAATLGSVLCASGYETAAVVSHSLVGMTYGFDRGFERWDESNAGGHAYVSSPGVTKQAIDYLSELGRDGRPFLLFVHYFDPHYDYVEHEEFDFGRGYAGTMRSRFDNVDELRERMARNEFDGADLQHLSDSYDSEIAYTDEYIGRLLDALRTRGLYEDALIVFIGDHGEMLAERPNRWVGHTRYVYDELVHVPLLVKLPRSTRTGDVDFLVSTVDVTPTILDVVGYRRAPAAMSPQRSLLRRTAANAGPVYAQTRSHAQLDAVLEGHWKLIRNAEDGQVLLFDLARDPQERTDRAAEEPEEVAHLDGLLDHHLAGLVEQSGRLPHAAAPVLSTEERERLRGLGYVE